MIQKSSFFAGQEHSVSRQSILTSYDQTTVGMDTYLDANITIESFSFNIEVPYSCFLYLRHINNFALINYEK